MNELTIHRHKPSLTPIRVTEMTDYKPSISELAKKNSEMVKGNLLAIIATYLRLNIKAKGLTNEIQLGIVIEHLLHICGNLEMREIEYIFREGIKGAFGEIYNDISLDTICGKNGWIEQYYREHRIMRPEPAKKEIIVENPNAITEREFLKRNREYKRAKMIDKVKEFAKTNPSSVKKCHVKFFMKLVGNSESDYKKVLAKIHQDYTSSFYKEITTLKEFARAKFVGVILRGEV